MYQPSRVTLSKYAEILVNYALNSGNGVKKGEVVQCVVPDVAKPMYGVLQEAVLKAGAHPLMRLVATGFDRQYYKQANDEQLTFFPKKYMRSRVDLVDHTIAIIAKHDLHELKDTPPDKIVKAAESRRKMKDWLDEKEYSGKFTWTLALFGTEAMAEEAGLTLEDYWKEIRKACFLDDKDPMTRWRDVAKEQNRIMKRLNSLRIKRVHIEAEEIDLWLSMGEKRRWIGGSGRNIPSFEIFTSPDWRGTEGYISFNQPLYRYGNLITGIRLEFSKGKIVKATADKNQSLLRTMIERPDADKVGEFSLTDSRFSPITKFMANTLFDENVGGRYGNTHIAIGSSYKDAYDGDPRKVVKKTWKKMGFNDSGEHCDMMSTVDRKVSVELVDGSMKVIYEDGKFTL